MATTGSCGACTSTRPNSGGMKGTYRLPSGKPTSFIRNTHFDEYENDCNNGNIVKSSSSRDQWGRKKTRGKRQIGCSLATRLLLNQIFIIVLKVQINTAKLPEHFFKNKFKCVNKLWKYVHHIQTWTTCSFSSAHMYNILQQPQTTDRGSNRHPQCSTHLQCKCPF